MSSAFFVTAPFSYISSTHDFIADPAPGSNMARNRGASARGENGRNLMRLDHRPGPIGEICREIYPRDA
jgi:hypothetical protein